MELSKSEQAIFDKLRWWRIETARAHGVPAYVVFQDATLREIAKVKPTSLDQLRGVTGRRRKETGVLRRRDRRHHQRDAVASARRRAARRAGPAAAARGAPPRML
jgi:superfamily II DNA helicase RecQ